MDLTCSVSPIDRERCCFYLKDKPSSKENNVDLIAAAALEQASSLQKSICRDISQCASQRESSIWTKDDVARVLWENPEALVDEFVAKVNQCEKHLNNQGFTLGGTASDGDCFFHAFLKSYFAVRDNRQIPILDIQKNQIAYLRGVISNRYKTSHTELSEKRINRAEKIRQKGELVTADGEGDLLAKELSIHIRVVTMQGSGISDMLTFPDSKKPNQNWDSLAQEEIPPAYIFIVDLGGHFIYAKPCSQKESSPFGLEKKICSAAERANLRHPHCPQNVIFNELESRPEEKSIIGKTVGEFLNRFYVSLPQEHQKTSYRILDVGCGNGAQAKRILEHLKVSREFYGIDNQPECIDASRKLLSEGRFWIHDVFQDPPLEELRGSIDILLLSHFYIREEMTSLLRKKLEYYAAESSLIFFLNNDQDFSENQVANNCSLFRPESAKLLLVKGYRKELYNHNYQSLGKTLEADPRLPIKSSDPGNRVNFLRDCNKLVISTPPTAHYAFVKKLYEIMDNDGQTMLHFKKDSKNSVAFLETLYNRLQLNTQNLDEEWTVFTNHLGKFAWSIFESFLREAPSLEQPNYSRSLIAFPKALVIFWYLKRAHLDYLTKNLAEKDREESLKELENALHFHEPLKSENLAPRLDKLKPLYEQLHIDMNNVEHRFLQTVTGCPDPDIFGIVQGLEDYKKLKKIRNDIKQKLQEIYDRPLIDPAATHILYQDINRQMKDFFSNIINECQSHLGRYGLKPRCKFAFIALGSFARKEMTPFSDLEFAILIDSEAQEQDKTYFRILNVFFHHRILNLGETIVPCLNIKELHWLFDGITPRGLSFDGNVSTASKTPYYKEGGNKGSYELIGTVQELLRLQEQEDEDNDILREAALTRYHLPTMLSCADYITGCPTLASQYEQEVNKIDPEKRKKRALTLMRADLNQLSVTFNQENNGKAHEIKKELYRLPQAMLDGLADYYQLQSKNSFDRVTELEKKGIFNPESAGYLKELFAYIQCLRLKIYYDHGRQKGYFKIDEHADKLCTIYYRLLPFQEAMMQFVKAVDSKNCPDAALCKAVLFSDSNYNQGIVNYRLVKYQEAYNSLKLAKQSCDSIFDYELLGNLQLELAKYEEALDSYNEAYIRVDVAEKITNILANSSLEEAIMFVKRFCKQAYLLTKKGEVYEKVAKFSDSKQQYEKARKLLENLLIETKNHLKNLADRGCNKDYNSLLEVVVDLQKNLEDIYLALSIFGRIPAELFSKVRELIRERGTLQKTKKNLNPLLKENSSYSRGISKDKEFNVKIDINLAKTLRRQAKLEFDNCRFQSALRWIIRSQKILLAFYRDENHPEIAEGFFVEGDCRSAMCEYQKALICHEKSLKIRRMVFGENHPLTAGSYNRVGFALRELGKLSKACEHLQKALDIRRELLGKDHPDVAASCIDMGGFYEIKGLFSKALGYYQQSLDIKLNRAKFEEAHLSVATSYNRIGSAYRGLGQYQKAYENTKKALAFCRKAVDNENDVHTPPYLDDLANICVLLGKPKEAQQYAEQALKINEKTRGKAHISTAISLDTYGNSLMVLGEYENALERRQGALAIIEKTLGKEHFQTAAIYNNMALSFKELGNYSKAREFAEKSANVYLKLFEKKHPHTLASLSTLGIVLRELGEYEKSLDCLKETHQIGLQVFGDNCPFNAANYNHLGITLRALGKYQESLDCQNKAFKIILELGKDHPSTATSHDNVGNSLHALGRYEEALLEHKQALKILERVLEKDHPLTARSHNNIGLSYNSLNNRGKAFDHIKKALDIDIAKYGENHPETATTYHNFVVILTRCSYDKLDLEKALDYSKKSLDIRLRIGKAHPDTASSYNGMANVFTTLGNFIKSTASRQKQTIPKFISDALGDSYPQNADGCYQKAVEYHQLALEGLKEVFDDDHPDMIQIYNNMGNTYYRSGDCLSSLNCQKRAMEICSKTLGEEHPETFKSYENLGRLYEILQNHKKEAEECFQKAKDMRNKCKWNYHRMEILPKIKEAFESHELKKHMEALFIISNEEQSYEARSLNTNIPELLYLALQVSRLRENHKTRKKQTLWISKSEQLLIRQIRSSKNEKTWKAYLRMALIFVYEEKGKHQEIISHALQLTASEDLFEYDQIASIKKECQFKGEKIPFRMMGLYYSLVAYIHLKNEMEQANTISDILSYKDESVFSTKKGTQIRDFANSHKR